jgi:RNA polymerase sigma-70 factor (ECF subfamily)
LDGSIIQYPSFVGAYPFPLPSLRAYGIGVQALGYKPLSGFRLLELCFGLAYYRLAMTTSSEPASELGDEAVANAQSRAEWRESFQERVVSLMDHLYRFALRLTHNPSEAEDLVSEAVVRAWDKIENLKDPNAFKPWIFQILANLHRNACRKPGSEVSWNETDGDSEEFWIYENLAQPVLMWWNNPEQDFLNSVLRDDIKAAMDSLPDSYRGVVGLVLVDGFSYEEVSQIMDVPIGTIRSRVSRGRSMMQKSLWQHAQDAGIVSEASASGSKAE